MNTIPYKIDMKTLAHNAQMFTSESMEINEEEIHFHLSMCVCVCCKVKNS